MTTAATSLNFSFLARHDPLLVKLASVAEQLCYLYPDTAILKLRQFAEMLAGDTQQGDDMTYVVLWVEA